MQANSILIGKTRHSSRSDRERDILQSQISRYVEGVRLATERRELEERKQRLAALTYEHDAAFSVFDGVFDEITKLVDTAMPCTKCGHCGAHEVSCSEL